MEDKIKVADLLLEKFVNEEIMTKSELWRISFITWKLKLIIGIIG